MRIVHRLDRYGRTPRPVRGPARVRAPPAQDQQQRAAHAEGQHPGADLERLVPGALGGEPVDGQEVRLCDRRIDGVHGRPVDPGAVRGVPGVRNPGPVRAGAGGARGEEPRIAQPGQRRVLRRVVVRGDAVGLDPAVPGVAVRVGAGPGRRHQPRRRHRDGPRQHQRYDDGGRDPAQREHGDREQRPAGRVTPGQCGGVGEVAVAADGPHEGGDEGGEGGEAEGGTQVHSRSVPGEGRTSGSGAAHVRVS